MASSTMFTLFWGGDVFAPNSLYDGVNIKEFLQEKYVNCYKHLASRIQHLEAVMGFELMNEPHPGYIGLSDFNRYDAGATLVFGDSPSALQSFALGDGLTQEIEVWIRSWPFPTRKHSTRLVNEEGVSAWIDGECIWKKHGVWDVDSKTGKPRVLNANYFKKHPKTGENVNFYKDFYLPFIRRYSEAIQSVKSDYLSFVEPIPNEPPPTWTSSDHHENIVYAPHWYDLESLFKKAFNGRITHDVQRLTRGPQHIVSATYFGISGAKKNYFGQVRNIVKNGLKNAGEKPCVIGECGIPMDINDRKAFETGDYTHHINFLDAVLSAMEKNLVNFTLWNYNPSNDNAHGDHWYGEDFSIFSPLPSKPVVSENSRMQKELSIKTSMLKDQQNTEVCAECTTTSPTSPFNLNSWEFMDQENHYDPSHHAGGRVLDAVLRPYAAKFPGIPQTMTFNLETKEFIFKFTNFPSSQPINSDFSNIVAPEVEIFIPNYHYRKSGLDIRVSDGDWRYVRSGQTLYWRVKDWSTEGLVHSLRIRVVDNTNHKIMPTSGSVNFSDVSKSTFDSNEFKHYNTSVILVLVVTLFLAMCSPTEIMFWAMGKDI
ncbi:86_t:CDS:2 [Acaulospora morrowiae]|uniref:86_t:CDS:1 n=1 Tax=Acaulospora morrowiae TaxID=94023 RepID=A0A9N9N351_9GLOM|nr:86_t:CDS:2 [Acaulospora morrowiae]